MKNDIQKPTNKRISGFGFLACSIVAIAFLLASCNLLFLNLGYEDTDPEFERLETFDEDSINAILWPTFQAMIQDDSGIASLRCTVQTGQGETKSLTIERTNERERYIWRVAGSLADVVSAGGNTLTFTTTDTAGNSIEKEAFISLWEGKLGIKFNIDTTQTLKVATFWHPSGITGITYQYVGDTDVHTLINEDDGTGDGGDKLFRGTLQAPPDPSYHYTQFKVTVNGSSFTMDEMYL